MLTHSKAPMFPGLRLSLQVDCAPSQQSRLCLWPSAACWSRTLWSSRLQRTGLHESLSSRACTKSCLRLLGTELNVWVKGQAQSLVSGDISDLWVQWVPRATFLLSVPIVSLWTHGHCLPALSQTHRPKHSSFLPRAFGIFPHPHSKEQTADDKVLRLRAPAKCCKTETEWGIIATFF
jgi:hypothetical protein